MTDPVRVTKHGAVTLVEMNQPDTRNALSDELKAGLKEAINELVGDKELKAVVLTGAGGVFCAGGDLKSMLRKFQLDVAPSAEDKLAGMREIHIWLRQLRDLPVPVITAVDGPAFGYGMGLALTGDIVIASDRASFSAPFCKIGAIPDGNLMWTLPRVVGLQRARELFYTGRVVKADEAQQLGLVMEVVKPDEMLPRAMEVASSMTDVSPLAFSLTKEITSRSMQVDSDSILQMEMQAQATCLTSEYHLEALTRFTKKQKPKFDFS